MKALLTNRWNEYLDKFDDSHKDIYFYEEYVKLYETGVDKAFCAVCYEGDSILLMPFIRKDIDGYYDFETAYGYGGVLSNVDDEEWINNAIIVMGDMLKNEKYICGFIRFHCLINNLESCQKHFPVFFDRNTVTINTEQAEEQIWSSQISSKNRNMIRKAEKNGLIYKAEYDFESIEEFINLYNETMSRLDAEGFYFFDKNYYNNLVENLKGRAFLGTVRKDGKLICAAIFMYSKLYGHYHLEGSDHAFSSFGANNFLLWKTSVELHNLGVKQFHLGGGSNCHPDNSLLKFKKSFSKNMCDYYIGKWIFNENKYQEIKQNWIKKNPEKAEKFGKLLLCYRY